MEYKYALIIDVASKQKYIYGSNRLRINLGASGIISHKILRDEINDAFINTKVNANLINNRGGNALIYFSDYDHLTCFLKYYSKNILVKYPGLVLECGTTTIENKSFSQIRMDLAKDKSNRRSTGSTSISCDLGIAQKCRFTDKPVNVVFEDSETKVKWNVNAEAYSKLKMADILEAKLNPENLGWPKEYYQFSSKIEDINPADKNGYVAVVHIDGNKMGDRFHQINDIEKYKAESKNIDSAFTEVLKESTKVFTTNFIRKHGKIIIGKEEIVLNISKNKYIVPFRSIINAGDDVTFVCHGKIAIWFTQKFLNLLSAKGITASAGIAIVHTKHPFYRAYQISDQLTKNVKDQLRSRDQSGLSFMIFKEGISESLDKILISEYSTKDFFFKQKAIPIQKKGNEKDLGDLVNIAQNLKKSYPNHKIEDVAKNIEAEPSDFDYMIRKIEHKFHPDQYKLSRSGLSREEIYEVTELLQFYPQNQAR